MVIGTKNGGVQITEPYAAILNEIQKSKTLRQDLFGCLFVSIR